VSVEWNGVERRRAKRKAVDQTVMISLLGGATVRSCAMRNLSVLGAGILLEDFPIPSGTSTYRLMNFERALPAASYGIAMLSPDWSLSVSIPRLARGT
jgi:hypothetical protein